MTQWLKQNGILLVLLVIAFAVYAPGLRGELVVDDLLILKDNAHLDGDVGRFFSNGFWQSTTDAGNTSAIYRPLVLVYFWLLHKLWGVAPLGYHVVLLLLHLADTALVYLAARRLLAASALAAALGAAVFALHPLTVESVAWISGVPDPLAAFFLLAALLSHHAYVTGRNGWGALLLAAGCFLLALGCKEIALVFPLVALAYDLFVMKRPRWAATGSYLAAAILYLIARGFALDQGSAWANLNWMQFPRALDLALGYGEMLVFPTQVPFYLQPPQHAVATVWGGCAAALAAAALGVAWWKFDAGRRRQLAFAVAWTIGFSWTALLMMFYLQGYFSARFLYVPLIGIALFIVLVLGWISERRPGWSKAAALACGLAAGAGGVVTSLQIPAWHDEEAVYKKVVRLAPDSSAGFQNLGFYYAQHNDPAQGEHYLQEAVRIDPQNSAAWTGLGNLAWMRGQLNEAIPLYEKALAVGPQNYEAAMNLASAYEQTGQGERAAAIRNALRR